MAGRSYVVGLPVVITVEPDGTVRAEVDLADAGPAIREEEANFNGYPWEQVSQDSDHVEAIASVGGVFCD